MSLSGDGLTQAWLNDHPANSFWSHHIGDGRPPADSTEVPGEDGLSFMATAKWQGFEFGYMDTLAALVSELERDHPELNAKQVAEQATVMAEAMRAQADAEAQQRAEASPADAALATLHVPDEAAAAAALLYAKGMHDQQPTSATEA